jgi:serine protease inhibitor
MKTSKRYIPVITLLLVAILFNLASCTMDVQAQDLMQDISPSSVKGKQADDRFIANTASFSVELFQKSVTNGENSLISPTSVLLALAMTTNGADKETLAQMQKVLGKDISIDELNEYLYYYVKMLPNSEKAKLSIANSIWFKDTFTVEKVFLQKNADYYKAPAYKTAFDDQTIADINTWVRKNTDGMIDKVIDEIPSDAIMYLINTVCFDAEWKEIYESQKVNEGEFTAYDGSKQKASFMISNENYYLNDGKATGFVKPYANGYSFVALLPNENVSIDDYVSSLTGEGFINLLKSKTTSSVVAILPKFTYNYEIKMNDILKAMGMPDAFDPVKADFSRIGNTSDGNIYISKVLHKTHITVDESGTRAGAVTKVELAKNSALLDPKIVNLDRPFVYAIIDDATNLPLFIGTVTSMN